MGGAKSFIKSRDYSFRYKSTVYKTVSYDQLKVGVLGSSITSVKRWKGTETLSARKTKDGNAIARVYRDVCNMSEYFHENGADVLHFKVGYDAPGENPPSNHSDGEDMLRTLQELCTSQCKQVFVPQRAWMFRQRGACFWRRTWSFACALSSFQLAWFGRLCWAHHHHA